ncbi:MAG: zinc-ribbon domain-containing protein [Desulfobacterales bacterium]|nr:zinc-ribbon domain-containing protein [Desulfobacterales bacterium]
MNITCPQCRTKLNLPDDKIPKHKDSAFKCPKCKSSIPVKASNPAGSQSEPAQGAEALQFQRGGLKQALVCMAPSLARNRVMASITKSGFNAHVPESPAQALRNLEYNAYPLVIVDDVFDAEKKMAIHMDDLDMSLRRRICLVKVSAGAETGNAMAALHSSVNYVIQSRDLEQQDETLVDDILAVALSEHESFYTVFNDSMKAAGKA